MPLTKSLTATLLLACALSGPVWAMDIGDAKSRGLVGETANGYIAAVESSAEVNALVKDINTKRKAQYRRIAEKNDISLEAVEVRAGQRAIGKTPAGQYINRGSGWERK
ncbi:MAG: YdbL family protein [Pseudomonadota bacterium]